MRQAAKDLAYGCGGTPAVLEVWETARNRQFQMSERPVTLMGCHFEVIRKDTQTMMQRATQVNATLQNKRLYMFRDVAAENDFLPSELNANRSYGYERQVFVLEEKVLVVANDKRKEYQSRFSNGDYAQNAMVGSVTEFADPFYEDGQLYYGAIWVQVEGRPVGAQMLRVLLAQHEAKVLFVGGQRREIRSSAWARLESVLAAMQYVRIGIAPWITLRVCSGHWCRLMRRDSGITTCFTWLSHAASR